MYHLMTCGDAVKTAKRRAALATLGKVEIDNNVLDNVYSFEYLGSSLQGDGDDEADVRYRMDIAQAAFASLSHLWTDHRLSRNLKLRLYILCVCSTVTHSCEAWNLMLVSHCGEYPCECKNIYSLQIRQIVANIWRMGLRMQFATNRNDRKMIARYSWVFVSIRGRSCGVANIMLLSHCGEYLANVKHLYSRHRGSIREK